MYIQAVDRADLGAKCTGWLTWWIDRRRTPAGGAANVLLCTIHSLVLRFGDK